MEPDYEKIIQNKIVTFEQAPVSWNREKVWMVIEDNLPRKRSPYRVGWLAAAAMLIVSIFLFVQRQRMEAIQQQARLVQLESGIAHLSAGMPAPACEATCLKPHVPARSRVKRIQTATPVESIVQPVMEVAREVTTLPGTETAKEMQPLAVAEERQVAPIIGYIPPPVANLAMRISKKSKLRIGQSAEPERNHTQQETSWIVARINP
jgi:hypothetical protein